MNTNFLSYLSCIGKLEEKRREVNEFCRFFFKFPILYSINFRNTSKLTVELIHSFSPYSFWESGLTLYSSLFSFSRFFFFEN